ncbi:MAG: glycosyltransferase [Proteobacteria bacterium]|nr:glycosyltransferase [Pseudomonadota bacterium]
MKIDFSVIIPALNEVENIGKCIEAIRRNECKDVSIEIIVVDHGSDDGTVEIARELADILIENSAENMKSISDLRNMGAEKSSGNILAFLDADMVVPVNWIVTAVSYFNDGYKGAIGFVEHVPESAGWVGKTWGSRFILRRGRKMDVDFLPGKNILINRHVFNLVGGFDSQLATAEDKAFTFKVIQNGFRVMSVPDINLIHLGYEKNLWEFIKKEFWRQGNTIKFAQTNNYSLRSLKNPIVSLWHMVVFLFFLVSMGIQSPIFVLWAFVLWVTPSALIVLFTVEKKHPFKLIFLFYLLTFFRWNISGTAFFYQLSKNYYQDRLPVLK